MEAIAGFIKSAGKGLLLEKGDGVSGFLLCQAGAIAPPLGEQFTKRSWQGRVCGKDNRPAFPVDFEFDSRCMQAEAINSGSFGEFAV